MVTRNDKIYDFALSFDGKDRSLARTLADTLIEAGYSVFIDEKARTNILSESIQAHIDDAFNKSRSFVVFIRSEYKENEWTIFEERIIHAIYEEEGCKIIPIQTDSESKISWLPDDAFYIKQTPGLISRAVFHIQNDKNGSLMQAMNIQNVPLTLRKTAIDNDDVLFLQNFSNKRAITVTHVFKDGIPKFEINFLETGDSVGKSPTMSVLFESHVVTLQPTPGYIFAYRGRVSMNIFPKHYTPQAYLFENMPSSRMSSVRENTLYGLYLDVTARPTQHLMLSPVFLFVVPNDFVCDPHIDIEKKDKEIVESLLRPRVDNIDGTWIVTKELDTRKNRTIFRRFLAVAAQSAG
jgi:hypothetical protein